MSIQQRSHVSLNAVAEEQCQVKLYIEKTQSPPSVPISLNETCVPPTEIIYFIYRLHIHLFLYNVFNMSSQKIPRPRDRTQI